METTLTVLRGHRTRKLSSGVHRYVYPELRVSAPLLAAAGLQPGDRVHARVVGVRIVIERSKGTTPSPVGAPRARRRRGATTGRKRSTTR